MTLFLQYLAAGLSTGSIYALVALGLALIYRSTRILNFAHGDITTAGHEVHEEPRRFYTQFITS